MTSLKLEQKLISALKKKFSNEKFIKKSPQPTQVVNLYSMQKKLDTNLTEQKMLKGIEKNLQRKL